MHKSGTGEYRTFQTTSKSKFHLRLHLTLNGDTFFKTRHNQIVNTLKQQTENT